MRVFLIAALAGVLGCAEWPRVANVPESGDIAKAGVQPGDLVEIVWESESEGGIDNDLPTSVDLGQQTLEAGVGRVYAGTLDGIGWADGLVPAELTDSNCPGSSGTRSPLGTGDYLEDVDFVVVDVPTSGTLCAAVQVTSGDTVGWDLVPQPLDPCRIPLGPLLADGSTVGVDLGGASGGWGVNVEPGPVAIGFAGYAPNDETLQLTYELAVSLVQPRKDGSPGVCPTHPSAPGGSE